MINTKISRFEDGAISGFTVKGHAGYAEAGNDIICAAVSALCYTAAGYFESGETCGARTAFTERDGYMKFQILERGLEEDRIKTEAVLTAWRIGLLQIQASYGKKYLKIIDV